MIESILDKTELSEEETAVLGEIEAAAPQATLKTTAMFPAVMLVCYLLIIFYFKGRGGYKPVDILEESKS